MECVPLPSAVAIEYALSRLHDAGQVFLTYRSSGARKEDSPYLEHTTCFAFILHHLLSTGPAAPYKSLHIDATDFPDEQFHAALHRVMLLPNQSLNTNPPRPFRLLLKNVNSVLARFVIRPTLTFLRLKSCTIWQSLDEFLEFLPSLPLLEDLTICDYITVDRDLLAQASSTSFAPRSVRLPRLRCLNFQGNLQNICIFPFLHIPATANVELTAKQCCPAISCAESQLLVEALAKAVEAHGADIYDLLEDKTQYEDYNCAFTDVIFSLNTELKGQRDRLAITVRSRDEHPLTILSDPRFTQRCLVSIDVKFYPSDACSLGFDPRHEFFRHVQGLRSGITFVQLGFDYEGLEGDEVIYDGDESNDDEEDLCKDVDKTGDTTGSRLTTASVNSNADVDVLPLLEFWRDIRMVLVQRSSAHHFIDLANRMGVPALFPVISLFQIQDWCFVTDPSLTDRIISLSDPKHRFHPSSIDICDCHAAEEQVKIIAHHLAGLLGRYEPRDFDFCWICYNGDNESYWKETVVEDDTERETGEGEDEMSVD